MDICRGTYLAARPQEVPYIHGGATRRYIHTVQLKKPQEVPWKCAVVHTLQPKKPQDVPWKYGVVPSQEVPYIEVLPERPREAQRASERHKDAQRGPERPGEAQRGLERPREAERG